MEIGDGLATRRHILDGLVINDPLQEHERHTDDLIELACEPLREAARRAHARPWKARTKRPKATETSKARRQDARDTPRAGKRLVKVPHGT